MRFLNSRQMLRLLFITLTLLSALIVGYSIAALSGSRTPARMVAATATAPQAKTAIAGVTAESMAEDATGTTEDATTTPGLATVAATTAEPALETFVNDRFDTPDSGWLVRTTETSSAAYVDGQYRLQLNGQPQIGFSQPLADDYFRLSVDVSVQSGAAGLIFLAAEPAAFYRLMIDREGRFSVQLQQNSATSSDIIEWTPAAAIFTEPERFNRLVVERRGDQVQCFVNEQLLAELTIQPGAFTSQYGVALAGQNNQGAASFDNLLGVRLPPQP